MSNNIKEYSGTGEFPAVPTEQSAKRPAFVMQPWLSAVSCPGLEGVPENVVPSFRAAPLIEQPASAVWSGLPTPELTPPPESCIPFFPKTIVTMRVGGKVLYGNQLVKSSGCTLVSRISANINPFTDFKVVPARYSATESDAEIVKSVKGLATDGKVWVYTGLVHYMGSAGTLTVRWPTGATGKDAELSGPEATDLAASEDKTLYPEEFSEGIQDVDCEIEGKGLLNSALHPTPFGRLVGYEDFTRLGPPIANANLGQLVTLPSLPAYVVWKPPETPAVLAPPPSVQATGLAKEPEVRAKYAAGQTADPGTVVALAVEDLVNFSGTLLALIDANGNIVQLNSMVLLQLPDSLLFKVSWWYGGWIIYLGSGSNLWVSGTKAAGLKSDSSGILSTALATGWYRINNEIESSFTVFAKLSKSGATYKREDPTIDECSVEIIVSAGDGSSTESSLQAGYPGSYRRIATITAGYDRDQAHIGRIVDDPLPLGTNSNQIAVWDNTTGVWKADYLRWT